MANLNGFDITFAGCDLLCHVCMPRVSHLGVLAFNPYSFNGVLCGSGIMVVVGGLLFHGRLLWVLYGGSLVRTCLHITPLALKANFYGSSCMVARSTCYPCSLAMGGAFWPLRLERQFALADVVVSVTAGSPRGQGRLRGGHGKCPI